MLAVLHLKTRGGMCCGTLWGKMYVQRDSASRWQQCKGVYALAELNKNEQSQNKQPFVQRQAQPKSNKPSGIRAPREMCLFKKTIPLRRGTLTAFSRCCSVLPGLLESSVCYMQLLTPADNTRCPQLFHYL